ncbi:hypothetical protein M896_100610, partial [Ordospora colligata OC4]
MNNEEKFYTTSKDNKTLSLDIDKALNEGKIKKYEYGDKNEKDLFEVYLNGTFEDYEAIKKSNGDKTILLMGARSMQKDSLVNFFINRLYDIRINSSKQYEIPLRNSSTSRLMIKENKIVSYVYISNDKKTATRIIDMPNYLPKTTGFPIGYDPNYNAMNNTQNFLISEHVNKVHLICFVASCLYLKEKELNPKISEMVYNFDDDIKNNMFMIFMSTSSIGPKESEELSDKYKKYMPFINSTEKVHKISSSILNRQSDRSNEKQVVEAESLTSNFINKLNSIEPISLSKTKMHAEKIKEYTKDYRDKSGEFNYQIEICLNKKLYHNKNIKEDIERIRMKEGKELDEVVKRKPDNCPLLVENTNDYLKRLLIACKDKPRELRILEDDIIPVFEDKNNQLQDIPINPHEFLNPIVSFDNQQILKFLQSLYQSIWKLYEKERNERIQDVNNLINNLSILFENQSKVVDQANAIRTLSTENEKQINENEKQINEIKKQILSEIQNADANKSQVLLVDLVGYLVCVIMLFIGVGYVVGVDVSKIYRLKLCVFNF